MTWKFGIIALTVILAATIAGGVSDYLKHKLPPAESCYVLDSQTQKLRDRRTGQIVDADFDSHLQAWRNRRTGALLDLKCTSARITADVVKSDYQEALGTISEEYASAIDYEKATQAAVQGMLSTLDPHSLFFSRAEYTKLKEDQDSELIGIGVTILRHRDGVYVQSAVPGTPAQRAGLRYGDRIIEVDGKDARDWSSEEVSKNVRGERGLPVRIRVERAGEAAPLSFTIVRESVPLPSLRNAYMIRPGTGYIGLTGGFQQTTGDELREAIGKLKAQGLQQVVLDLRGNPGGLLQQAIDVASEFLPRDYPIVSVHGRVEYKTPYVYRSTGTDPEDFPLVVVINHNSASASEIVTGAIQDYGRGLVVGQTSFGKGLVQHLFPLPFGAGMTLTIARYYTPYGRSLQRDYSNGSFYDYYTRREEDEELPPPKTSRTPAQQAIDPTQAQPTPAPQPSPSPSGPAIKTAGGRIFYGGGGITPDIEVKPLDITPLRGRIAEAAFLFTRQLAAGKIPGLESYRMEKTDYNHTLRPTDYQITDRIVQAFRDFVQRDGQMGFQPAQIDNDLDFVKQRLRVEIVTAAYGNDAGARVLIDSDPQILRAIDALPDAKRLAESIRNGGSQG